MAKKMAVIRALREQVTRLEGLLELRGKRIIELRANQSLDSRILANVKNDRDGDREALDRCIKQRQKLLDDNDELDATTALQAEVIEALRKRAGELHSELDENERDLAIHKCLEDEWRMDIERAENKIIELRQKSAGHSRLAYEMKIDTLKAELLAAQKISSQRYNELKQLKDKNNQLYRYEPHLFYLVDWYSGEIDRSCCYSDWYLAQKTLGKISVNRPIDGFSIELGKNLNAMVTPRLTAVDGFKTQ